MSDVEADIKAAWVRHWAATGNCPESGATSPHDIERSGFRSGYFAAIKAGYRRIGPEEVVVPRVPTVNMLVEATEQWLCIAAMEDRAATIWDAMIHQYEDDLKAMLSASETKEGGREPLFPAG